MGRVRERIAQFWRWVEGLHTAAWIVGGVMTGLGISIWSLIEKIPVPLAITAGICAAGGIVWLLDFAKRFSPSKKIVEPDYAAWDAVQAFPIGHAASLWAESPIIGSGGNVTNLTEAGYARLKLFKERIKKGEMKGVLHGQNVDMNTEVSREDLIRLAEQLGERPKFLYKDAR